MARVGVVVAESPLAANPSLIFDRGRIGVAGLAVPLEVHALGAVLRVQHAVVVEVDVVVDLQDLRQLLVGDADVHRADTVGVDREGRDRGGSVLLAVVADGRRRHHHLGVRVAGDDRLRDLVVAARIAAQPDVAVREGVGAVDAGDDLVVHRRLAVHRRQLVVHQAVLEPALRRLQRLLELRVHRLLHGLAAVVVVVGAVDAVQREDVVQPEGVGLIGDAQRDHVVHAAGGIAVAEQVQDLLHLIGGKRLLGPETGAFAVPGADRNQPGNLDSHRLQVVQAEERLVGGADLVVQRANQPHVLVLRSRHQAHAPRQRPAGIQPRGVAGRVLTDHRLRDRAEGTFREEVDHVHEGVDVVGVLAGSDHQVDLLPIQVVDLLVGERDVEQLLQVLLHLVAVLDLGPVEPEPGDLHRLRRGCGLLAGRTQPDDGQNHQRKNERGQLFHEPPPNDDMMNLVDEPFKSRTNDPPGRTGSRTRTCCA